MSRDLDIKGSPSVGSIVLPLVALLVGVVILLKLGEPGDDQLHDIIPLFDQRGNWIDTVIGLGDSILTLLIWQLEAIAIFALLALIPGTVASLYQRPFQHWFLFGLITYFLLNTATWVLFNHSLFAEDLEKLTVRIEYLLIAEALFVAGFVWQRSSRGSSRKRFRNKKLVFCIDGTWNYPGQTDRGFVANTNVFKLWRAMCGNEVDAAHKYKYRANRIKSYKVEGDEDTKRQLSFYYNGVGNYLENTTLGMTFGGAFGFGAERIVRNAYYDLVRHYAEGDEIYIFGFSRGAAIARMLAAYIEKHHVADRIFCLRVFGTPWILWRGYPKSKAEGRRPKISFLGVWDTVASFGIPKNIGWFKFQEINLFKDLKVAESVQEAWHIVALDESRDAFKPTLMTPDPINPSRINEVWFSGNHANVGGGYATDGLSDVALDSMLRQVALTPAGTAGYPDSTPPEGAGLYVELKLVLSGNEVSIGEPGDDALNVEPRYDGRLRFEDGPMYHHAPRDVPLDAQINPSVKARLISQKETYRPEALFMLNRRIVEARDTSGQAIDQMIGTALEQEQADQAKTGLYENLQIHWYADRDLHRP